MINATHGANTLQQQLQHFYDWEEGNNMHYNGDKFELIRCGKTETKPIYHTPAGTVIKQKNSIRDLGVLMSSNAKFDTHIKNTAAAGHRIAGWVPRGFKTRALQRMLTLLKTLVVSQTEYCSPLWSPTDTINVALLKRVQLKFPSKFAVF